MEEAWRTRPHSVAAISSYVALSSTSAVRNTPLTLPSNSRIPFSRLALRPFRQQTRWLVAPSSIHIHTPFCHADAAGYLSYRSTCIRMHCASRLGAPTFT